MAKAYQDIGRYDRGIEVMKRSTPNYFAIDLTDLPRPYWEALFPKAYWNDLSKYAAANGLDPYLVASLIRQESEFNAAAVSRANAVGLMQLLPKTGRTVAKQAKLKGYKPAALRSGGESGTGHALFQGTVDNYNGRFEYALAAYNAGDDRVADGWGTGIPRSAGIRGVNPVYRDARVRAGHPAQRERVSPAVRNAVDSCELRAASLPNPHCLFFIQSEAKKLIAHPQRQVADSSLRSE